VTARESVSSYSSYTDTIETKILKAAGNKRKLEAMVISKGKFGAVGANGEILLGREAKGKAKSVEEMAKELLDLDSEEITLATKDDRVIR
jgi:ATP-dependent DNA helicase